METFKDIFKNIDSNGIYTPEELQHFFLGVKNKVSNLLNNYEHIKNVETPELFYKQANINDIINITENSDENILSVLNNLKNVLIGQIQEKNNIKKEDILNAITEFSNKQKAFQNIYHIINNVNDEIKKIKWPNEKENISDISTQIINKFFVDFIDNLPQMSKNNNFIDNTQIDVNLKNNIPILDNVFDTTSDINMTEHDTGTKINDNTLYNRNIQNEETVNKNIQNEETVNKNIQNEETVNKNVQNEETVNKNVQNEETVNKNIQNEETVNKNIQNEETVNNSNISKNIINKSASLINKTEGLSDNIESNYYNETSLQQIVTDIYNIITQTSQNNNDQVLYRNIGGDVPGIGNTDTVPAMLTPGEYVINKESTQKYKPILEQINNDTLPKNIIINNSLNDVSKFKHGGMVNVNSDPSKNDFFENILNTIQGHSIEESLKPLNGIQSIMNNEIKNAFDQTKNTITLQNIDKGIQQSSQLGQGQTQKNVPVPTPQSPPVGSDSSYNGIRDPAYLCRIQAWERITGGVSKINTM
jgi:preprotein translocase subunit SecE